MIGGLLMGTVITFIIYDYNIAEAWKRIAVTVPAMFARNTYKWISTNLPSILSTMTTIFTKSSNRKENDDNITS